MARYLRGGLFGGEGVFFEEFVGGVESGAVLGGFADGVHVFIAIFDGLFVDVADVKDGLGGEEAEVFDKFGFVFVDVKNVSLLNYDPVLFHAASSFAIKSARSAKYF